MQELIYNCIITTEIYNGFKNRDELLDYAKAVIKLANKEK